MNHVIPTLLAITVALMIAFSVHYLSLAVYTSHDTDDVLRDLESRIGVREPIDSVAAHFKQSAPGKSGPAALAYLFTRFGDHLYEADIYSGWTRPTQGFSPAMLVVLAAQKGYQLQQMQATYDQLPDNTMQPVIALMKGGLYVVVHHAKSRVAVFDPQIGRIIQLPQAVFLNQWQGLLLRLKVTHSS